MLIFEDEKPVSLGDAICVVTDGGENATQTSQSEIEDLLMVFACSYFFPLGTAGHARSQPKRAGDLLSFATRTAGSLMIFVPTQVRLLQPVPSAAACKVSDDDQKELAQLSQTLQAAVKSFYKLDVHLPATLDKPGELKVDVIGASGSTRKCLGALSATTRALRGA